VKKAKKILAQLEDDTPAELSPLSVVVDFNQLHAEHGTAAFELIGQLKDLLR
jgi:hypothetical protein